MTDGAICQDKVHIGDCKVKESILCDEVRVQRGASVGPRCILAFRVVIGPGVHLPAGTRLTVHPSDDDHVDEDASGGDSPPAKAGGYCDTVAWDANLVGVGGCGRKWEPPVVSDSDEEDDGDVADLALSARGSDNASAMQSWLGRPAQRKLLAVEDYSSVSSSDEEGAEDDDQDARCAERGLAAPAARLADAFACAWLGQRCHSAVHHRSDHAPVQGGAGERARLLERTPRARAP